LMKAPDRIDEEVSKAIANFEVVRQIDIEQAKLKN
jgi:hypothetical protein